MTEARYREDRQWRERKSVLMPEAVCAMLYNFNSVLQLVSLVVRWEVCIHDGWMNKWVDGWMDGKVSLRQRNQFRDFCNCLVKN